MNLRKLTAILGAISILLVFALTSGAWCRPCNPVRLPVTYENQIGRDITNDSVWNEGLVVRKFENKTQVYLVTKYKLK